MDTMSAFAMGQASRGEESMVFDWDKAARLIKEKQPHEASAGLEGDWENTGGEIYRDGKIVPEEDACVFLASTWAAPQLDMDGDIIDCFKRESDTPGWDSGTYWPESAKRIITGKEDKISRKVPK